MGNLFRSRAIAKERLLGSAFNIGMSLGKYSYNKGACVVFAER